MFKEFLLSLSLVCCVSATSFGDLIDSAELAKKFASAAEVHIAAKVGTNTQYRVAVFPFGDRSNKVTVALSSESLNIQGEMIVNLRRKSSGKFFVLDNAGLERAFREKSIDPVSIDPSDPNKTAEALKKVGIQAAIVGSYQFSNKNEAGDKGFVLASIIFSDGTFKDLDGKIDTPTIPDSASPAKPSGRFKVEFIFNGKLLKLQQGDDKDGHPRHHNVFFVIIPENAEDAKGKTYTLRVSNVGKPQVGYVNPDPKKDESRLYAVAVKVDGVNSIYQDDGNGKTSPVNRHPKNCSKWVLTPPGAALRIKDDGAYTLLYDAKDRNGKSIDHSKREILGFQDGTEFSRKFTLGSARESVAETIGITNSIGLIEAHFYPEKLNGDIKDLGSAGTYPGEKVPFRVKALKLELQENPAEVWRIFYRYKDDPSVGPTKEAVITNP